MSRPPILAGALSLLLLLSATLGSLAHDHSSAIDLDSYACAVDHERAVEAAHAASPGFDVGGSLHEHQCFVCHLSSARSLANTLDGEHSRLTPRRSLRYGHATLARRTPERDATSPRGPPRA